MKLLLVSMVMALVSQSAFAQSDFVKGADVGFLTGQEKHGVKFHDRDGKDDGKQDQCRCRRIGGIASAFTVKHVVDIAHNGIHAGCV